MYSYNYTRTFMLTFNWVVVFLELLRSLKLHLSRHVSMPCHQVGRATSHHCMHCIYYIVGHLIRNCCRFNVISMPGSRKRSLSMDSPENSTSRSANALSLLSSMSVVNQKNPEITNDAKVGIICDSDFEIDRNAFKKWRSLLAEEPELCLSAVTPPLTDFIDPVNVSVSIAQFLAGSFVEDIFKMEQERLQKHPQRF